MLEVDDQAVTAEEWGPGQEGQQHPRHRLPKMQPQHQDQALPYHLEEQHGGLQ